jgi:hypothetical protein
MDIIQDLPNDLKYTIKDIVIDYRNKHSFGIKKIFDREIRGL